nr:Chain B, Heat shock protein 90 [Caenorhabditis elegans]
EDASRMEEVD